MQNSLHGVSTGHKNVCSRNNLDSKSVCRWVWKKNNNPKTLVLVWGAVKVMVSWDYGMEVHPITMVHIGHLKVKSSDFGNVLKTLDLSNVLDEVYSDLSLIWLQYIIAKVIETDFCLYVCTVLLFICPIMSRTSVWLPLHKHLLLWPEAQIGAAIYWPLDTDPTWILHLKYSVICPDSFIHLQEPLNIFRVAVDPKPILRTLCGKHRQMIQTVKCLSMVLLNISTLGMTLMQWNQSVVGSMSPTASTLTLRCNFKCCCWVLHLFHVKHFKIMQSLKFPKLFLVAWPLLLHLSQLQESYLTCFVSFMPISHKSYNASKSRGPLAVQDNNILACSSTACISHIIQLYSHRPLCSWL